MSDIYKAGINVAITGPIIPQLTDVVRLLGVAGKDVETLNRKLHTLSIPAGLGREIRDIGLGSVKVSGEIKTSFGTTFSEVTAAAAKSGAAIKTDMAQTFAAVNAEAAKVTAAIGNWGKEAAEQAAKMKAAGGTMGSAFGGPGIVHSSAAAAVSSGLAQRGARGHGKGGFIGQTLDMAAMGGLPLPNQHHLVGHTMREAGSLQSEIVRMMMAGRGEFIESALKASQSVSRTVPTSNIAENMARISEMAPVFGDVHEAIEFLPQMAKLGGLMKAIAPKAADPAYDLAKALELQGVKTTTPEGKEEFSRLLSGFARASIVTGGKVGGSDFLQAIKYTRGFGRNLSEDFLTDVVPSLIQEMGGAPLGTVLKSYQRAVVGGKMTKEAKEDWGKLGLLDKDGKPLGALMAAHNPLEHMQKVLLPKLAEHGITSSEGISNALMPLFSRETAFQFGNILALDNARLHKDAGQYKGAMGLDEAYKTLLDKDYATNTKALGASLESLQQALGNPAMPKAIEGAQTLTGIVHQLTGMITGTGGENSGVSPLAVGMGGAGVFGGTVAMLATTAGRRALGGAAMGYMMGGTTGAIAGGLGAGGWSLAGGAAVGVPLAVMALPTIAMGTAFGAPGINAMFGANGFDRNVQSARQQGDAAAASSGMNIGKLIGDIAKESPPAAASLNSMRDASTKIAPALDTATGSMSSFSGAVGGLIGILKGAAGAISGTPHPLVEKQSFRQTPTAGPPPRATTIAVHTHLNADGRQLAKTVTYHQVADLRFRSPASPDDYGHHRQPGAARFDAA